MLPSARLIAKAETGLTHKSTLPKVVMHIVQSQITE